MKFKEFLTELHRRNVWEVAVAYVAAAAKAGAAPSIAMLEFAFMPVHNRNHPVIGKHPRFLALLKRMGLEGEGGDAVKSEAR